MDRLCRRLRRRPRAARAAGGGERGDPGPDRRRPRLRGPGVLARRRAHRVCVDSPQRLLQHRGTTGRRGPLGRRRDAGHGRPRLSRQPVVLRPVGHAHHAGVAAGGPRESRRERRAAAGLEPGHPPGLRQRPAGPRRARRYPERGDGAAGADPVPRPAGRGERRPALRLLVDAGRGGSVQQPVRAADGGGRALQADVLRARRVSSALVARRRVDRVHQRTRAACRGSRCSRRTGARCARWRSPSDGGERPMGVLSVRTRATDTGDLTGSRIHLTASDGKFYAPADAYARHQRARRPRLPYHGRVHGRGAGGAARVDRRQGLRVPPGRRHGPRSRPARRPR